MSGPAPGPDVGPDAGPALFCGLRRPWLNAEGAPRRSGAPLHEVSHEAVTGIEPVCFALQANP